MPQRTASQKDFQLKVIASVLLVVLAWLLLEYSSLLYKRYQIEVKKDWFITENQRLVDQNKELEKRYEYSKTDYFFRKEAKRKLNKKEPGEKVIIITGGDERVIAKNDWDISKDLFHKWWDFLFLSSRGIRKPLDINDLP